MARGIWKGTIGFGLVTIGVELYGVEAPERLDLDLLDRRDMGRIGYQKINKTTHKPVEQGDIVRGFAVSPSKYVVLTDEDLKRANPVATRTIDVVGFVPRDAVPPIYLDKPYYAGPIKGSERAYALLRDTMEAMDRVAIARVVIRTRQYVAMVYSFEDVLVTHLLRYDEELRKAGDLGLTVPKGSTKGRPAEVSMARQLVEGMAMKWQPKEYRDEYRDDILKLVKRRARGAKEVQEPPEEEKEPKVLDLMEALRKSVASGKRSHSTRKSAAPARRSRRSA